MTIPLVFFNEKNLLATGDRWIWLYEIEVPTSPETRYRFVRDMEQVTFRGNIYYPFPVSHSPIKEDIEGSLPTISLTVSNISREVMSTLENYSGLIGQPVRIILTHELALSTGAAVAEHDFKILGTTATDQAVSAKLGDISLYEVTVPATRMLKHYCRHQYRGSGCGYAVDPADANYIATCDKTLDGPNGCSVHGTSESDAGVAVVHPDRFGGFPGIPTPTTGGAL